MLWQNSYEDRVKASQYIVDKNFVTMNEGFMVGLYTRLVNPNGKIEGLVCSVNQNVRLFSKGLVSLDKTNA